jgi:integral membrane protein
METNNVLNRFLQIGKVEGISYITLLFIAMPLKYLAAMPLAVRIVGAIHGALFVAFMAVLVYIVFKKLINIEQAFYAFLLSIIPFGTFFLKKVVK